MFRKLVSNLPFSPALVGQIGFYAKRLKKEEATRRLGLIFTALALVVQSFAVFSPPEPANAAGGGDCSPNAIITCGAFSIGELRQKYNQNAPGDLPALFGHFGLTSDIINNATVKMGTAYRDGRVVVDGKVVGHNSTSLGRSDFRGGQYAVGIGGRTYYSTPNNVIFLSNTISMFAFFNSNGDYINGVLLDCGNPIGSYDKYVAPPVIVTTPPRPTPPPVVVQPPSAACSSLAIKAIDRTRFQLTGTATTERHASINHITYVVKDSSGKTILTQEGAAGSKSSVTVDVTTPGSYTAEAIASTSLGDRTSANCVKAFTVSQKPMCEIKPDLPADSPECKPCEGNPDLWYKDEDCKPEIKLVKSAVNVTQGGADATKITAKPGDIIEYTLKLENKGLATTNGIPVSDRVNDIMEYASMRDTGGGNYVDGTMKYADVTLKPNTSVERKFSVQVSNPVPLTPQGQHVKSSYDCKMSNNYGDSTIDINVECPVTKTIIEEPITTLPATGPRENMIFAGVVLAVVSFFYARSRQLGKEVRLVRKEFSASAV